MTPHERYQVAQEKFHQGFSWKSVFEEQIRLAIAEEKSEIMDTLVGYQGEYRNESPEGKLLHRIICHLDRKERK